MTLHQENLSTEYREKKSKTKNRKQNKTKTKLKTSKPNKYHQ